MNIQGPFPENRPRRQLRSELCWFWKWQEGNERQVLNYCIQTMIITF